MNSRLFVKRKIRLISSLLISLTTCFVAMKCFGIITWGWLLCLSPLLFLLASYLAIATTCIAYDIYVDRKYESKWRQGNKSKEIRKKKD